MGSNIYKNRKPAIFFILPAFLFMIVYLYYPFFRNIINSFQQIGRLGTPAKGWNQPWYQNYVQMLSDKNMHTALINIVISATALGLLFNLIFLYNKGMLNQLMEKMGHTDLIDWKAKGIALITMMVPVMWQYVGFYFVILITGLNNISVDLYEVASIDGATRWQRIRYITIPLMRNVICTCVVLAVTGALKVFDLPWVMFLKGMPQGTTFLTGTYMYYQTMEAMNVDYGSAIAVMIVALGIITSKVVNTIFKEVDY